MNITREEFDIKFEHYFKLMYKVAYGYTLNSNDAEDIVQESFYRFYRAHKTFEDDEQEKYYSDYRNLLKFDLVVRDVEGDNLKRSVIRTQRM